VPTKLLTSLISILLFTACNGTVKPEPYRLPKERTGSCQEEIEKTIASLIHAQNLSISKDVFSKTSSLYVSNQKNSILRKSPIYNNLRGRKTLFLYEEKNALHIGLMNKEKDVVKSQRLHECLK